MAALPPSDRLVSPDEFRDAQRLPRVRAPLCVTAVVGVTALFASAPLVEVGAPGVDWALAQPPAFLALAPVFGLLDLMSTLTVEQHIALIATALLAPAILGMRCRKSPLRRIARGVVGAAGALGVMAVIYALGTLVPRPMTALARDHADDVIVDFHAHSDASWDGRSGWGRREVRRWQNGAGFDAAYVTDHKTLWSAGWRDEPADTTGVRLLPGIEGVGRGEHLNLLGVTDDARTLFPDLRHLDVDVLRERLSQDEIPPIVLLTIPAALREPLHDSLLHAVEISDAAPKGLAFGWTQRRALLALADSLNLAPVAGSDNHGWGSTAAAWSVLRVPGWRSLDPASLDRAIRTVMHRERRRAVRLVERPALPGTGTTWGAALTVPLLTHALLTRLSPAERLSWTVWAWSMWALVLAAARASRHVATLRLAAGRDERARLDKLPEAA